MTSFPPALVAEIRHVFRTCARHCAASRRSQFSTCSIRPISSPPAPANKDKNLPIQVIHSRLQAQRKNEENKDLVLVPEEQKSLHRGRKVDVPLKVIPKAEIAPGLTLSPKERLHIEQLTRRLPPRREPRVYKKRIRIYSAGNGRIYMLTFGRFITILGLSFVTGIMAPALWTSGSSLWAVAGVWLLGFVPFVCVNWLLRPVVTEVFLKLPAVAQGSPKAAMAYATNLPADASLDLRFMRTSTITDVLSMQIANTRPAKSMLRPVSFEWFGPMVNRGTWLRPNPTHFFVQPNSTKGKAARDVTPGIWAKVYERLTGVESGSVSKWRR